MRDTEVRGLHERHGREKLSHRSVKPSNEAGHDPLGHRHHEKGEEPSGYGLTLPAAISTDIQESPARAGRDTGEWRPHDSLDLHEDSLHLAGRHAPQECANCYAPVLGDERCCTQCTYPLYEKDASARARWRQNKRMPPPPLDVIIKGLGHSRLPAEVCPECGYGVRANQRFCGWCSYPLDEADTAAREIWVENAAMPWFHRRIGARR